jgi:hypothetical protein
MNARRDPDAILAAWLDEGPDRLPEATKRAIAVTTRSTHQTRHPMWVPWRFPTMNGTSRLALGVVAVVAVALGGLYLFNRTPQPGVGGPGPSPSASIAPSPSAEPSSSPSALPALTGTHTSAIYGISTSYPSDWTVVAATQPWTSGLPNGCDPPCADRINEKEDDSAFLSLSSQPLDGRAGDGWATQVMNDPRMEATCPPTTEPVSIDGAPGRIAILCPDGLLTAFAWTPDRGYFIVLYGVDDVDWFKEILATVRLHPEDALVAPSADPSSNPSASPS